LERELIGYGVAYLGVGNARCNKLEAKFSSPMEFVINLDLQVYSQPMFIVACYNQKTKYNKNIRNLFVQTCNLVQKVWKSIDTFFTSFPLIYIRDCKRKKRNEGL